MTLSTFLSALWAHRTELLVGAALVVAATSALIKALEALVAILVTIFPGLAAVDGQLKHIAALLDALAKAPWLNALALSPKKLKVLLLPLLVAGLLTAAPAQAQVLVSSGPTIPLMLVRPGNPHPISLAAGAGYQLSFTTPAFQRALAGRAWDLLDVNLMAFGSAVSSSSGEVFGAFSAAVGLCTLSTLFCVGVGHDVATSAGMKPGWFGLFALSINFGTAPEAPPVGVASGTLGMVRGNHLYFGAF